MILFFARMFLFDQFLNAMSDGFFDELKLDLFESPIIDYDKNMHFFEFFNFYKRTITFFLLESENSAKVSLG